MAPRSNPNPASVEPSPRMFNIVAADSPLAHKIRCLYVGVGGDVTLVDAWGTSVNHKNVPSGSYLGPFEVVTVAAATTASSLIGYA